MAAADGGCTVSVWIWSGGVALLIGGLAFMLCFIPILVWQYRRFGRPNPARVVGAAAVSIYGAALVSYTMLPLPQTSPGWCSRLPDKTPQLVPFNFLDVVGRELSGGPLWGVLSNFYALQVVFNVLLFLPWGIIMRRYFSRGFLVAAGSGFLVSLAVELTQYTGIWGVYECAYRLADVDDLMMNTLGALLGALLAPLLLWWMPSREGLAGGRNLPRPVTSRRRWFGMLLDGALFVVLSYLIIAAAALSIWLLGYAAPGRLDSSIITGLLQPGRPASPVAAEGFIMAGLLVFYLPACFGSGASLGQRIVWLGPAGPRNPLPRRLWRATVGGGLLTVGAVLTAFFADSVWIVPFQLLLALGFVLFLILVPFSRGQRGLSYALSGTELADSRSALPQITRSTEHTERGKR